MKQKKKINFDKLFKLEEELENKFIQIAKEKEKIGISGGKQSFLRSLESKGLERLKIGEKVCEVSYKIKIKKLKNINSLSILKGSANLR